MKSHGPLPHLQPPNFAATGPAGPAHRFRLGRVGWQQAVRHLSRPEFGMQVAANTAHLEAFQNLPADLQDGTLIDVNEEEEIDPTDGCRVQVVTYRILSADQSKELTKTFRRKLKIDCTQTTRMEVSNGRETKVEEKCERMRRDIKGLTPIELISSGSQMLELDPNSPQDVAISNALMQVPDTFVNILSKEKDMFVKMYPELFEKMRSESTLVPSTTTEVITNPDGSTVTRMKSSKSYSSHFSRHETYVNGVKKMSKSKFRAFVEYRGPEGGFHVKLTDHADDEISEDEEDDKASRCHSEMTDIESEMVSMASGPVPKKEVEKRHQKAWFAAKELVDSEERYVEKLKLLGETFRDRVLKEDLVPSDKAAKLFSNIASLHQFHNKHFLPQLMEAIREWHTTKRIANVVRKQAPFLKMYSEYTNNYDRASKLFEEFRKKKKFNDVVKEIEKKPECEGLPLSHHLICPVQRVMRYQLLLQEYKKHLEESDVDFADTAVALDLVVAAAQHANEMMKKLDGFGKVIEVQEQLGNSISLVSPGRELLKCGSIQKISSTTEKTEERFIFLFTDLLILASERKLGMAKYKLRAVFHANTMQIGEGDNLEREHSFYIRGSAGGNTGVRRVELFAETQKEKSDWVDAIFSIIDDATQNGSSSVRSSLSDGTNISDSRNCAECDFEFSLWSRGTKCSKCKRKMCKKCFGRYRSENKRSRVCEHCTKTATSEGLRRCVSTQSNARANLLYKPASGKGVLHASRIKFRGSLGKVFDRYMVVRNDFCLYSYKSAEDDCALAMLPLPGCEVKICGEKFTFSVRVGARRMYTMTAEDEQCQARWMAVLDLASNAQLAS